jgi:alkyl hydroperoxide reductase subunit AhpC
MALPGEATALQWLVPLESGGNDYTEERTMGLQLGATAPDFVAQTTEGTIRFHEWIGDSWAVLFSHPKDFTPICTTELGSVAKLSPEFQRRNVKLIGLSVDSVEDHYRWLDDIEETQGARPDYPIIADTDLNVSKLYGMLEADAEGDAASRCAMDNRTVRSTFVIDPAKRVRLITMYPMQTGRNFTEMLRAVDSIQLTTKHPVATPASWQLGEDVMLSLMVSDEKAKALYGDFKAPKPYIRIIPSPHD